MDTFKKITIFVIGVYIIFTLLLIYKLSSGIYILLDRIGEYSKANMELISEIRSCDIMQGNPNFIIK